MTKFFLSLSLFFLLVFSVSNAQDNELDSLKNKLNSADELSDTTRAELLNGISYALWRTQPEKAIDYGKQALELSRSIDYKKGMAIANKHIGLGYYVLGEYVEVLFYWEASLEAFRAIDDKTGVANLLGNIGAIHFNGGDNAVALDYYLQALKVAEEIKDDVRVATMLTNIGSIYMDKKSTYDRAINYFHRALKYAEKIGDQNIKGTITNNLTEIYLERDEYDSALFYVDKAMQALDGTGYYAVPLSLKGEIYKEQGDYRLAAMLQSEAVETARSYDQKLEIGQSLLRLGETYLADKKPFAALKAYKEALNAARDVGSNYQLKDAYGGLAESYEQLNEFENAYRYKELYAQMKDTVFNMETEEKIRGLQFSYQIEKQQDEINLLAAQNEIQELDNERQKAISWAAGVIGFLIFLGLIGLFHRYRFINKIKKVIEKEKDRSENLLLNILPADTAEELKEKGEAEAKQYDSVSILFTDFKGFTSISTTMSPRELVKEIHECFKMFDIIMSRYGVEKIKTIGDAYMAAGGLPKVNDSHPVDVARAALDIREYMNKLQEKRKKENRPFFEIRIGIHTGPVVAGIVGIKKFAYDIWGDTVNVASRMESNSEAGKINISESTYKLIH
ncbi:MAG: adenylate/guanylate cyclase domain-containing protein, partial [Fulvivirga sp.]|nr:adenylate/guanylate cyclase domain-containing protein [Fulvivirga sp.]